MSADPRVQMILTYVPEASYLPFSEALAIAKSRDIAAADRLTDDAESALNLEAAAEVANAELDAFFETADVTTLIGNLN